MTRWLRPVGAALVVAVVVVVLGYFQPQKLFLDKAVDEALPQAVPVSLPTTTTAPVAAPDAEPVRSPAPPAVAEQGSFRSGEHTTTGTVQLLTYPDGRRYVRLVGLRTSNGPRVVVWLSEAVAGARDGTVRRGAHLDLGALKGNIGNQNYLLPQGTDLSRFSSVVIWCARFHVAFGSAPFAG